MHATKRKRWTLALVILSVVDATTGAKALTAATAATPATVSAPPDLATFALGGTIRGSGSTFADRFYKKVVFALKTTAPGLQVVYRPIGSGKGKADFGKGVTDFAGTDSLVKHTDGPKAGEFMYVPTAAAPITVAYHLTGVSELRLSAPTLARIFQRDVTRWNDPVIQAENPNVVLPSRVIGVVHRFDSSGTTSNFTKYLTMASGDLWRLGAGDSIAWPSNTAAASGNPGVARLIKLNNGSIGYVDLSDAKSARLSVAAVRNKAGHFVLPTLDGVSAALAQSPPEPDLTYQPLDAAGVDSYPITAPTYLLVRITYRDQPTADAVKGFVRFVLTDGQTLAGTVNYAKLPETLRVQALAQLDKIGVGE